MKDKTKTLLTGEIQVTPFDSSYNELDRIEYIEVYSKVLKEL